MIVRLLRLWFGLHQRVTRTDYALWGTSLMALKYAVEVAILWVAKGQVLTPFEFADPLMGHREHLFGDVGTGLVFVWTLPFIWIGLSMSFRRAVDSAASPWLGVLFLVPFVNWLFMIVLCCIPSRPPPPVAKLEPQVDLPPRWAVVLTACAAATGIGGAMVGLSVYVLHSYGGALFVVTPIVMGLVSAMIARTYGGLGLSAAIGIGQSALLLSLLAMVAMAVEGTMCVAMAWPIAAPLVLIGSVIGGAISGHGGKTMNTVGLLAVFSLPTIAWHDAHQAAPLVREVVSMVEIDAPPEVVWRRVVSFPDLPAPDGIFALGIACPLRARILGQGVGAIRRCEFTTGPFIEPITVWEPGRRLAFDVISQPPAMRELSIWSDVKAPHLDGYLTSLRGEFRLVGLPGGRTRLEGRTWYQVDVHPEGYWLLWAGGFIHAIHDRVLTHISRLAKADAQGGIIR